MLKIKKIVEKKFKSKVVLETVYGVVDDYGEQDNTMTLMRVNNNLMIEWVVGDELDYSSIGITAVGHDVVDYDGVFEIPKEAIELLQEAGFNTKEIEVNENEKE